MISMPNSKCTCDVSHEISQRGRLPHVIRSWAIPVAFTADNRPLLGPVDGIDGLVAATALKSTIIWTPVVGELVAGLIADSRWDARLDEFSPTRRGRS